MNCDLRGDEGCRLLRGLVCVWDGHTHRPAMRSGENVPSHTRSLLLLQGRWRSLLVAGWNVGTPRCSACMESDADT